MLRRRRKTTVGILLTALRARACTGCPAQLGAALDHFRIVAMHRAVRDRELLSTRGGGRIEMIPPPPQN